MSDIIFVQQMIEAAVRVEREGERERVRREEKEKTENWGWETVSMERFILNT